MLRLRVNYLSSSSKSTNPPEFTSPSTYVFQCALFLLLPLCSLFNIFLLSPSPLRPTLCSPRFVETLGFYTVRLSREGNCTDTRSSYVGIFQERELADTRKWKTREIDEPSCPNKTRGIFRRSHNNFRGFFSRASPLFLLLFLQVRSIPFS